MTTSHDKIIAVAMSALPESLATVAEAAIDRCDLPAELPAAVSESLPRVISCSQFVADTLNRHPDFLEQANVDSVTEADDLAQRIGTIDPQLNEAGLMSALREHRNREMLRLAWRDLAGWADLAEVMRTMSGLADNLVDQALRWAAASLQSTHGKPIGAESGNEVQLVVMGLGKLGGGELNFSSDIDLIFTYAEEGDTDGPRSISNHEYFTKLGRKLIKLLGENTKDGFVFRVDMRLRPNGNSGPLALSFDAMEHYYQVHGRDWERYALIKMRPIAGDIDAGNELIKALRPFIFRRYLDFGAVESIREMKQMINQELQKKGIEYNVKLGPGGIREIEFIGQSFQLIRGGREPDLQQRPILTVLPLLVKNAQLTQQALAELQAAYDFLRRTEHRLQMIADQQTHLLPEDELNQARVAFAMGYPDWQAFLIELRRHMYKVHNQFEMTFSAPQGEAEAGETEPGVYSVWRGLVDNERAKQVLQSLGYSEPGEACRLLDGLRGGRAYAAFSSVGRERMDKLMPLLISAAGLTEDAMTTLARLIKLIESIGRRSAYFVLLVENPMALSQLVKLCAASAWISDWISRHPVVMDELLDANSLYESPAIEQLEHELVRRLQRIDGNDLDAQMNTLREFHHGQVLRVAAADVGPGLATEVIGQRLSDIAEVILRASLGIASANMIARYGRPVCAGEYTEALPFVVIAYGKLGSQELGYGSDLDLTFLYGDCEPGAMTDGDRSVANETFFARLGQRLIHILNTRTAAGSLYEVDMRLRPSGQSGALVTGLAGFEIYQMKKAWTWEHQALVRARPVAGPEGLREEFAAIRKRVLCQQRDAEKLSEEVVEMRGKMREGQQATGSDEFNLKHDEGGLVDIEFLVQYGVLSQVGEHPELLEQTNNVTLLDELARIGFVSDEQASVLKSAYLHFLQQEYRRKLLGKTSKVSLEQIEYSPERAAQVWNEVMGAS